MRMLLKAQLEVEAASRVIQDGSFATVMQGIMEKLRPEAAYFSAEDGMRTAFIFFDLQDLSDIPSVAEPFFQGANAKISLTPAMNVEELQAGLKKFTSAS